MSLEALGVGQGLDGNSQLSLAVLEIVTFHDADAACIAVNEAFIPMKPVCCCIQLMRVDSSASNGVDQARCGINSNGARIPKKHGLPLATECIVVATNMALRCTSSIPLGNSFTPAQSPATSIQSPAPI